MAVPTPQEAIESAYRDYGTQLWRGVYAYSGGRADIADEAFVGLVEPNALQAHIAQYARGIGKRCIVAA